MSVLNFPLNIPLQSVNKIDRVQNSLEAGKASKNNAQLKKACFELESLFINQLLKEMRATIPKSGFIGGGSAEEIYTSMMDSQLAKEMAFKGGMGLAAIFYNQLCTESEDLDC